jgi:hypothetical protein
VFLHELQTCQKPRYFFSNQIDLATNMMKELISRLSTESTITHTAVHQSGKIVAVFGVIPCNL